MLMTLALYFATIIIVSTNGIDLSLVTGDDIVEAL